MYSSIEHHVSLMQPSIVSETPQPVLFLYLAAYISCNYQPQIVILTDLEFLPNRPFHRQQALPNQGHPIPR